jgi:hypothetical protein
LEKNGDKMPITLTFHNFSEKQPKNNEYIIYLKKRYSFGSYGFEPRESTAEYMWNCYDSEGYDTGCSVCYSDEDPTPPEMSDEEITEGYEFKLKINVDGYYMEEGWYWCTVDEWFNSLPKED